jgi:hypothetical protein
MMKERHTGLTVLKPIRTPDRRFSKGEAAMETMKAKAAQSSALGNIIANERTKRSEKKSKEGNRLVS